MGDMDDGFDDESTDPNFKSAYVLGESHVLAIVTEYLGDAVFARRFIDCMNIMRVKNVDYSQGEDKRDRVAAFRRIARDIDISMRQVWAVFAQKHWGAIMKFVKDGSVESEPLDGRINDLINYCVLLGVIAQGDTK